MSPLLREILSRRRHFAFGWRPSRYEPDSSAAGLASEEEMAFYVRCHAFLAQVGHPLRLRNLLCAELISGVRAEDVELTSQDRADAIRWHLLVRPHVAGEGWN